MLLLYNAPLRACHNRYRHPFIRVDTGMSRVPSHPSVMRVLRRLIVVCVTFSLLAAGSSSQAAAKASLHIVPVPAYRISVEGQGWSRSHVVTVSLHAGPWAVSVRIRPNRNGAFTVGARQVDLCGGVSFQARDPSGRTASVRGPQLMCPSMSNPPKPTLTVLKGKQVQARVVRLLAPNRPGAVTIHRGDELYVWEAGTILPAFTPQADETYLELVEEGTTPPRACPQVDCASGFYWIWLALHTGIANIDLSPACRQSRPPCGMPDFLLRVHILP